MRLVAAFTFLLPAVLHPTAVAQGQPPAQQAPAPVNANRLFEQSCATCHGNAAVERAPDIAVLRKIPADRIYEALTVGAMRVQAANLNDDQKRALAELLGERKLADESADVRNMPNTCQTPAPLIRAAAAAPAWNGWGVDVTNSRFQPGAAAGLPSTQVQQLQLEWAFGFPGATAVYGQPTVFGGRVFVGVNSGYVYALDAATGCGYWSFQAQSGVRTAITVAPSKNRLNQYNAYFGDMRGNVYAVDASTGMQLWKVAADDHSLTRITGAPTWYEDRLYVPVSSLEEGSGASPGYPCCTFRGSLVALDAETGRQLWKSYTIAEKPAPRTKNSRGVQLSAPAGAAVWVAPTIDVKRRAVYVATGDAYTAPAAPESNAVLAFQMDTGERLWVKQGLPEDAWLAGCVPTNLTENCPRPLGPDHDFASSPILATVAGRDVLITAQKSGTVWAMDPDRKGEVVWKVELAAKDPGATGEVVWGGAFDGENVYVGLTSGGLVALRAKDGGRQWLRTLAPAIPDRTGGHTAALSAIPGVVFSPGWDGVVRALSSRDGAVLWQYDTAKEFETANKVKARGGSMGAPGPTIAGGMLFVGSGYIGFQRGMPGNVLLAFAPAAGPVAP